MSRPPPRSTLFPYTTLFRSLAPPVTIRALASGGHIWRDPENLTLAAGTRTLDITDRKSTRLNSSHMSISYAVFCLKKKKENEAKNNWAQVRRRARRQPTITL